MKQCGSVPPDEKAHGGVPFATWYLRQLAAYQKKTGRRLLDYFDNHWYPQENGVTSNADSPAEQALRLRSTRMLWDPNYRDQSWINQPVMAIPRMKQLVAQNYPGTKVAISEYNFGALDRIDGGLAEADVLGIFGKQGLDLATLWGPPAAQQPGAFAFAMLPGLRRARFEVRRHQRALAERQSGRGLGLRRAAEQRSRADDHRDQQVDQARRQPAVDRRAGRPGQGSGVPVRPGQAGQDRACGAAGVRSAGTLG